MSVTLPTAINLHNTDWDLDARARGAFAGTGEAIFGARAVKTNGNFPLTTNSPNFTNNQASSSTGPLRGVYYEYLATGGYDVSSDTRVFVCTWQFNAPNRVQVTDLANDGIVWRVGSGGGSPPTNYKSYQIGGNDTPYASAREIQYVVLDLNDVSHEATVGTFDNTDVQTYGFGTVRFNISGTSTNLQFIQRAFVFTTTKGSADIPTFTGGSDWGQLVTLVDGSDYTDKISDGWAQRAGNVFSFACPISFGDGSTATNFVDNGATVFFPDADTAADPRIRATRQAFRVYADLRNNAADTIIMTGRYDCGNTYPDWDFDSDLVSSIFIDGAQFKRTGTFSMGSSVSGAATFDGCDRVEANHADVDLDGSIFRSPRGPHALKLVA